ncbi:MAG: hypothetical protein NZ811_02025 [Gammaproteobacteria bacterium]|nr:hypothetical protein [Gammaproteobacteria bacterium]
MSGILGTVLKAGSNATNLSAREIFAREVAKRQRAILKAEQEAKSSVNSLKETDKLLKPDATRIFRLKDITPEGDQFTPDKFFFSGKGRDKYHIAYTRIGKDGQKLAYWKGYWRPLADVKANILRSGSSRNAFAKGSASPIEALAKNLSKEKRAELYNNGPQPAPGRNQISESNVYSWIGNDVGKGLFNTGSGVKSRLKNYIKKNPYVNAEGKTIDNINGLGAKDLQAWYSKIRDTPEMGAFLEGVGSKRPIHEETKKFIKDFGWADKKGIATVGLHGRLRGMGLTLKDLDDYVMSGSKGTMERFIPDAGFTNPKIGMVEGQQIPGDVFMRNIYNQNTKTHKGRTPGVEETKTRVRRTKKQMEDDAVPLEDRALDVLKKLEDYGQDH